MLPPIHALSWWAHLNEQLYAYTSPEKYATFYLGIYDEAASVLSYTNAGHLPPILIRNGEATRLNVDGTVVGAFPFSQYDESRIAARTRRPAGVLHRRRLRAGERVRRNVRRGPARRTRRDATSTAAKIRSSPRSSKRSSNGRDRRSCRTT